VCRDAKIPLNAERCGTTGDDVYNDDVYNDDGDGHNDQRERNCRQDDHFDHSECSAE
jgi:hypothetical protein